ncbi:MAG: type VI secretion system contractile sheath domain-containing protein, partial [Bacteroidota bacterium]
MLGEVSFIERESLFVHDNSADTPLFSVKKTLSKPSLLHRFLQEDDDLKSILLWIEQSSICIDELSVDNLQSILLTTINEFDVMIEKQINNILHHEKFQGLEASWRGLAYLIEQKETQDKEDKSKIKVLNCSWQTLSKDFDKAIEFDQSDFYKLVHNNEYDMSG